MSLMARTGVHRSKRVGGLDTRPERVFFQTCLFGSAWQLGLVESTHMVLRRLLLMGQAQTSLEGFNYSILHWRFIGGG